MTSNQRRTRRSIARRSKPLNQSLSAFWRNLSLKQRQHHARRQRQIRQVRVTTPQHAAGMLMRYSAIMLVLLTGISLVLNAIPIQLSSPRWYLQALSYIADYTPVLILSGILSSLSLIFISTEEVNKRYRRRLVPISRFGYTLVLVLLPVQLGLSIWLFGQTLSSQSNQLASVRNNINTAVSAAQQVQTNEQFISFLRSRNITANFDVVAATPLAQVRTEFIRIIKANQAQEEQKINYASRMSLLGTATKSVKLFLTLCILAVFMRVFHSAIKQLPQ